MASVERVERFTNNTYSVGHHRRFDSIENVRVIAPTARVLLEGLPLERRAKPGVTTLLRVAAGSEEEGRMKHKLLVSGEVKTKVQGSHLTIRSTELGLQGLTQFDVYGGYAPVHGHIDSAVFGLGREHILLLNGRDVTPQLEDVDEYEVPHVTRDVRIQVPQTTQIAADISIGEGSLLAKNVNGTVRVQTGPAAVRLDNYSGSMEINAHGGPVEVFRSRGILTVHGGHTDEDVTAVLLDRFTGIVDINTPRSPLYLTERSKLESDSKLHIAQQIVVKQARPSRPHDYLAALDRKIIVARYDRPEGTVIGEVYSRAMRPQQRSHAFLLDLAPAA